MFSSFYPNSSRSYSSRNMPDMNLKTVSMNMNIRAAPVSAPVFTANANAKANAKANAAAKAPVQSNQDAKANADTMAKAAAIHK